MRTTNVSWQSLVRRRWPSRLKCCRRWWLRRSLQANAALHKIATLFLLVLIYMLFLLILSGEGILRATYSIGEQVYLAETSYCLIEDSLELIRFDIFKVAAAAPDTLMNDNTKEAHPAVLGYQKEIESQINFLRQDAIAQKFADLTIIPGAPRK